MFFKPFELRGHRQCPHKTPSNCNTSVIPMLLNKFCPRKPQKPVHTHSHSHTHTLMHTLTHTHTHTHTHAHTHTLAHTHTHTHTLTHSLMHTLTHTLTRVSVIRVCGLITPALIANESSSYLCMSHVRCVWPLLQHNTSGKQLRKAKCFVESSSPPVLQTPVCGSLCGVVQIFINSRSSSKTAQ